MEKPPEFNPYVELMKQRQQLTDALVEAVKNDKLHHVPLLQTAIEKTDSSVRYEWKARE